MNAYDYVIVGSGIAVDYFGNAHIVGTTGSADFPCVSPWQPSLGGGWDAFVAELNPSGSALGYSSYLGGSGEEYGNDIALDPRGDVVVVGRTQSETDFPTFNAFQPIAGWIDGYITKLGERVYRGDIDGNGVINVLDVRLCHQMATGYLTGTAVQRTRADVDSDGDVDMDDAAILAEYVTGMRVTLP